MEQYQRCPFSFYLKYGLRLQEPNEFKLKSIDTGSFIHNVIDEFFDRANNVREITEYEITELVQDIIDEKLGLKENYIFNSTAKFRILTKRMQSIIIQAITYIVFQIQSGDFDVIGHEVEFTHDIDGTKIVGKVDRIDSGTKEGQKYIRVIDYKSSTKDIDLNGLVNGLQIQLITYLDVMSKKEQAIPAGMMYFNVIDPIINAGRNMTDEDIEREIRKQFKLNGIIISDINIIKMMDKKLEKGSSSVIPVKINSDGTIDKRVKNTLTKEQFGDLQEKARRLIKQISNEIKKGNIDIKPIYSEQEKRNTCEFCNYRPICRFDNCDYRYIRKKSKEVILDEIRKGVGGENDTVSEQARK